MHLKRNNIGVLFILPAIVYFGIFFIYPLFQMFYLSLHSWSLLSSPKFVGLENYRFLSQDSIFIKSANVTFYYLLGMVAFGPLALILGIVFNQEFRLKQFYWGIFFAPYVISLVVSSLVWKLIYNPSAGLLTLITDPSGLHIKWLKDEQYALPAIMIYSLWVYLGYYSTLWLAGLKGIPHECYEAAAIDGAGKWAIFWYITLPLLKPVALFIIVVSIIGAVQMFVPFFVMTQGGPAGATQTLAYYIYKVGFSFLRMGYACTVSVILFVIVFAFALIQVKLFRES